ncbi:hypothetical protein [Sphingomonas sp. Leaf231]|uniref:hypothetical protein n=1 Tax=Sphingomonas sp. Leaf231 TaxID=1736301 RepID=UPI000B33B7DA|nr:hypothetical protein [Sphingomonas sp. Leaf231]
MKTVFGEKFTGRLNDPGTPGIGFRAAIARTIPCRFQCFRAVCPMLLDQFAAGLLIVLTLPSVRSSSIRE